MRPRDANVPLPETICCGGTQKHQHYSGKRAYTLRELACLQGFPVLHRFEGNATAIRKQIGNAFPPCVANVLFKHFFKHLEHTDHLERTDGVQSVRRPPPPPSPASIPTSLSNRRGPRDVTNVESDTQRGMEPHPGHYNGEIDEDEALELALKESRKSAIPARRFTIPVTRAGRVQDSFFTEQRLRRQGNGGNTGRDVVRHEPQLNRYNGGLDEDEALDFALKESKKATNGASHPAASDTRRRAVQHYIDLRDSSDEDQAQDSPVNHHFAPLMERMSIASSRSPSHGRHSPVVHASQDPPGSPSRSRSVTLDFSPGPCQKRSLEDMHDGVEDLVMKKESPEKRERFAEPVGDNEDADGFVIVDTIPARLPKYGGHRNSSNDGGDGYIVLGGSPGSGASIPRRDTQHLPTNNPVSGGRAPVMKEAERKGKSPAVSESNDCWIF